MSRPARAADSALPARAPHVRGRAEVLAYARMGSPLGDLHLVASERGLCALSFADRWEAARARLARRFGELRLRSGSLAGVENALRAYFAGAGAALDAIDVDVEGTRFQRAVWGALRQIPLGQTWSYAELARAIEKPRALRAVGAANGANPVALVLPCHRVCATGGGLGGYAGGLARKRWLLAHEGARSPS